MSSDTPPASSATLLSPVRAKTPPPAPHPSSPPLRPSAIRKASLPSTPLSSSSCCCCCCQCRPPPTLAQKQSTPINCVSLSLSPQINSIASRNSCTRRRNLLH
ncbi:hypothetical protein Mapa_015275 [Marchantia paleacea]|nr:hypothetical protein Mapa_015275 [Marchantia paleacea]